MDETKHVTLGRNVVPANYNIKITPNMKGPRYSGEEVIKVEVGKPTNRIKLNAKELVIKGATITFKNNMQKCSIKMMKDAEEVELKFKDKISGRASVWIRFGGVHNEKLYGFYRSSYTHRGKRGTMLTTQLEPADARAVFPCFDEPEFKATFNISLVVGKGLEAISNMPIASVTKDGKNRIVNFQATPMMSTYLIYMGVGAFERKSAMCGPVKISVVTVPGMVDRAQIPLDYCKKFLPDLESYFGVRYPFKKLDLIAVPDFAAGAMENWGAITFRAEQLLLSPKGSSAQRKQTVADTIAHELVHQWFGDLVTMEWWNDMWLNESFATFMAQVSIDRVMPEWKTMVRYRRDTDHSMSRGLMADCFRATHPISVTVGDVNEIDKLFDDIGYDKGGSMLFMLYDYVGDRIFRKGLQRYLKRHAYSNATRADLWDAVQKEATLGGNRAPIKRIMEQWLEKSGYPIVDVEVEGRSANASQRRFTLSGDIAESPRMIPIKYIYQGGEGTWLMGSKKGSIKITGDWIKLNHGQSGFYRCRYDAKTLATLGKMLAEGRLGALDGWGLEDDLFMLVRAGREDLDRYLDFIGEYCKSPGNPLDTSIAEHLGMINHMAMGQKFGSRARRVSMAYHRAILARLGWETRDNEYIIDAKLRGKAIEELGRLRDPDVVSKASALFRSLVKNNARIDPNISLGVYTAMAVNYPSGELLARLMKIYKADPSLEEKMKALLAVGMMADDRLLAEGLDTALSTRVRMQDSFRAMVGAYMNTKSTNAYARWMMANWKTLMARYSQSGHALDWCAKGFGMVCDEKVRDEIARFFAKKENLRSDIVIPAKQSIEKIDATIRFIKRNE